VYQAFKGTNGLSLDQFKEAVKTLYGSTKNKHINNAFYAYAGVVNNDEVVVESAFTNMVEAESSECEHLCKSKGYRAFDCDTTIAAAETDPGLPCAQVTCAAGQVCVHTYYTYASGGEMYVCVDDPEA